MAELVSDIYSEALFDTAVSNGSLDEIKAQMNEIADLLDNNADYIKMLASPIVSVEEKHSLAEETFGGRVCDYVKNLIFLLIDNGRFGYFIDINDSFNERYDKHNNILRVKAVTAAPLSDEMQKKLADKLSGLSKKNVIVSNETDEKVIGGILLQYNNVQIDATVQARLDEIKKQIIEKTV